MTPTSKKVPCKFTHPSSFHWQSDLSDRRQQQLIEWERGLSDIDRKKLHDLLDETRFSAEMEAAEDAAGVDI